MGYDKENLQNNISVCKSDKKNIKVGSVIDITKVETKETLEKLKISFSSLLNKKYSKNIYGKNLFLFSFNSFNIGVIEYREKRKLVFIDLICSINNKNFGYKDFRGDYFEDEFGIKSNINIPGLGTHMFLEFLKEYKSKGFEIVVLRIDEGAEGFYEKIIDRYNGVYFDFYKDDFGNYIFNLI